MQVKPCEVHDKNVNLSTMTRSQLSILGREFISGQKHICPKCVDEMKRLLNPPK